MRRKRRKMEDIEKIETRLKAVGIEFNTDRICEVQIGGVWRIIADIPEDLNAIRELELMVIGKFGMYSYGDKLFENVIGLFDFSDTQRAALFATADAQTRITAMLAVIEEGK